MHALVCDWEDEQIENEILFANLMSLIANTNRDPKRKPQPYTGKDFLSNRARKKMGENEPEPDPQAIYEALKGVFGNKVKMSKKHDGKKLN